MSTQLIPFSFESTSIRVVMIDDDPWFVAADVCAALDLVKTDRALDRLDDDEKGTHSMSTLGGAQGMNIINEPGLYSLILTSRKPEAKAFKRWITHEVLPAIRQTGSYTLPKAKPLGDSLTLKHRQAKVIASTYLSIAKLFGTDAPMARAIAADQVKQQTGIDFMPLLAGNIIKEKPMTPTELGKIVEMSPRKVNALLALQGFQEKHTESGDWIPTDKGRTHCTCNPFKSPHSEHTGYRTLWYRSILNLLDCGQSLAA